MSDWLITQESAHKICELTVLTLPVLALSYLIADRYALREVTGDVGPEGQRSAFRNAVWFLAGATVGILAGLVGIVVTMPKWMLILEMDCFALCLLLFAYRAFLMAAFELGKTSKKEFYQVDRVFYLLGLFIVSTAMVMVVVFDFVVFTKATVETSAG